ncbi:nucleoside phosphorylase-I family protein [Actinomyces weissii]|uniref:Purine-nucleoside phosphorylase n=1 Tax=Actinomyces weissii TaxID=675090 RepID=A0A7T7M976_9ACTO|nr:purine-nucleoside phosphorylase [Actinomyces weissii]QQM67233.1 purine-nucleoside phosphorylase [Actinomyces weissii]
MTSHSRTVWEDDPDGASILLATGRARHDLLVVAEPAFLTEVDAEWGRPMTRARLSFLPGVAVPGVRGQADDLRSYERDGMGILVARGRSAIFEGKSSHRILALARLAASARVRGALLVGRATSLGEPRVGEVLPVADHVNLTGAPLFTSKGRVRTGWDEGCLKAVSGIEGMGAPTGVALVPGPTLPTPLEARVLSGLGVDAAVTDSVAEAMLLCSRGARVAGLAIVDSQVSSSSGYRGKRASVRPERAETVADPTVLVLAAIEAMMRSLREPQD